MAVTADTYVDLTKITLDNLGRLQWTDLASDLQEHVAMGQLLKEEKITLEGGTGIEKYVMIQNNGLAEVKGPLETDDVDIVDVMTSFRIPWGYTRTKYALVKPFIDMNASQPEKLVDYVKTQRIAGMASLADKAEALFWGVVPNDGKTPFGIQYWDVYNATAGFTGGNNANFSSGPGGIDRSTYARWKNWSANYTDVSNTTTTGLVWLMKKALRECAFKPSTEGTPDYAKGQSRYQIYLNGDTLIDLETYAEGQNDQLGKDIATMQDQTVFRKVALTWVPYLDNYSTSDPVYMVDWAVFRPVFLAGWYLKEDGPDKAPYQHNVLWVFIDMIWNIECTNPRKIALIAKADPANGV